MEKKYTIIASLILLTLSISCSQKHNLEALIPEIGEDTIYVENYLLSSLDEDPIMDTIYSKDGRFFYDLPANEPFISIITPKKAEFTRLNGHSYRPDHRSMLLILKPEDRVKISGSLKKDRLEYQVKGSELNEKHSTIRNNYSASKIEEAKIELTIDSLMYHNGDRQNINELFKKRKEFSSIANEYQMDFVRGNLDNDLSAFYLIKKPLDTLGKYMSKLDPKVRDGIFSTLLDQQFLRFQKYTKVREAKMRIQKGNLAPHFELKSLDSSNYSFKPPTEKYIVLDFWGSWCAPCIAGFPKMKDYYNKYRDNLEIIGIACNDTESKWRDAVKTYDLDWENLINQGEDINKDVSVMYAIMGFPTKIIINPDGTINQIFDGEGDDFYTKIDELMRGKAADRR